jgi:hypothetical protein
MTTLSVTIDLDNAAFFDARPADEIRACFARVADRIETQPCGPSGTAGAVLDTNGNSVGRWVVQF